MPFGRAARRSHVVRRAGEVHRLRAAAGEVPAQDVHQDQGAGVVGHHAAPAHREAAELGPREGVVQPPGHRRHRRHRDHHQRRPPSPRQRPVAWPAPAPPRPRRRRPRPGTAPGRRSSAGSSSGRPARTTVVTASSRTTTRAPVRVHAATAAASTTRRARRQDDRFAPGGTCARCGVRSRMPLSRPPLVTPIRGRPSWSATTMRSIGPGAAARNGSQITAAPAATPATSRTVAPGPRRPAARGRPPRPARPTRS